MEKNILWGTKDPSMDLWVLPLTPNAISNSQRKLWTSQGDDEASYHINFVKLCLGPGGS